MFEDENNPFKKDTALHSLWNLAAIAFGLVVLWILFGP
jgi:hypothetical protein